MVDGVVYDVDVAPVMLLHVDPPLVLSCHCTVADGLAIDDAVNVAVEPLMVAAFTGCCVMIGAYCTVKIAAVVLVDPAMLVNTARYCTVSSTALAVTE